MGGWWRRSLGRRPNPTETILQHPDFTPQRAYISHKTTAPQTSFACNGGLHEAQNMIKEEPSSVPVTSTVINIHSDTGQPDYVTWSLFNSIYMNFFCLGFAAYVFSVKVSAKLVWGGSEGCSKRSL